MIKVEESKDNGRKKDLGRMVKAVGIPYHRRAKLIPKQTNDIMFMRAEGFSLRQIAEYLGVSDSTVYRRIRADALETAERLRLPSRLTR